MVINNKLINKYCVIVIVIVTLIVIMIIDNLPQVNILFNFKNIL